MNVMFWASPILCGSHTQINKTAQTLTYRVFQQQFTLLAFGCLYIYTVCCALIRRGLNTQFTLTCKQGRRPESRQPSLVLTMLFSLVQTGCSHLVSLSLILQSVYLRNIYIWLQAVSGLRKIYVLKQRAFRISHSNHISCLSMCINNFKCNLNT